VKISNEKFDSKSGIKALEAKCQILDIRDVLGRRWSLLVLKNLSIKKVVRFNELKRNLKGISSTVLSDRFNELKRNLKGISSTVLSDRLSELEQEGLITKKIYPEIPLKVEYSLTTKTKDLEIILQSLNKWCEKWESKLDL